MLNNAKTNIHKQLFVLVQMNLSHNNMSAINSSSHSKGLPDSRIFTNIWINCLELMSMFLELIFVLVWSINYPVIIHKILLDICEGCHYYPFRTNKLLTSGEINVGELHFEMNGSVPLAWCGIRPFRKSVWNSACPAFHQVSEDI